MIEVDLPSRNFADVFSYFTSAADRAALVSLFDGHARVLEIGIQEGYTADLLLKNLPNIRSYVGIDVTPDFVTELTAQRLEVPAVAGIRVASDPRVRTIVKAGGSAHVIPSEIGKVDAAFIDADHSASGVERDTDLARACVRPGGIIVWHDYRLEGGTEVNLVLDRYVRDGAPISHVRGTWVAFERIAA